MEPDFSWQIKNNACINLSCAGNRLTAQDLKHFNKQAQVTGACLL